ncbi:MAG: hypothetical protein ACLFUS_06125 [Candidatus Sumerlaeia bacterium]
MASFDEYSIPPGVSEEVRDRLYSKYRAILDEAAVRRNQETVIDLQAREVATSRSRRQKRAENSERSEKQRRNESARSGASEGGASKRSRPSIAPETLSDVLQSDAGFMYSKGGDEQNVEMKMTPYQRGLFIDVEA